MKKKISIGVKGPRNFSTMLNVWSLGISRSRCEKKFGPLLRNPYTRLEDWLERLQHEALVSAIPGFQANFEAYCVLRNGKLLLPNMATFNNGGEFVFKALMEIVQKCNGQTKTHQKVRYAATDGRGQTLTVFGFFHFNSSYPIDDEYKKGLGHLLGTLKPKKGWLLSESGFSLPGSPYSHILKDSENLSDGWSTQWSQKINRMYKALKARESEANLVEFVELNIKQGAPVAHTSHQTTNDLLDNIRKTPTYTNAFASIMIDFASLYETPYRDRETVLSLTLHSIEMACRICQKVASADNPPDTLLVCGLLHRAAVSAFVARPSFLYHTLVQILSRINRDFKRNGQIFDHDGTELLFKFELAKKVPQTPAEIAEWVEANPNLFPLK